MKSVPAPVVYMLAALWVLLLIICVARTMGA